MTRSWPKREPLLGSSSRRNEMKEDWVGVARDTIGGTFMFVCLVWVTIVLFL